MVSEGRRVLCVGYLDGRGTATVIVENNWRDNVEIIIDEGRRHVETKHKYLATIDAVGSGMVTLW
jgi:hypothetical protein